ncbi:hypothetical protein [Streptomyces bambusae]|uniref:LRV domain-containing protein n=1 Tax=Streptomyces bambusae TaxID=1550616 RepID=A0ABS6Z7E6_9ACTN|nr:hypothetical protein [Streptomyces bambusae]MBW5483685.1 hypothetical protein [Streptomyces bambusae]
MDVDREFRRLAWCVAHLLRHAPDAVTAGLLRRLDPATRRYLARDQYLPGAAVTLLLREGSDEDRRTVARNPHVLGRPLPGLPGPVRYAARPGPPPELRRQLGPGPLTGPDLVGVLRRHGRRRPRTALDVLTLPHELDPELLLAEQAREPLPPGAVEALLLVGRLPRTVCLALLDTRAQHTDGPAWHRPAVRAVRMGLLTPDELAAHVAPARRALLLADLHVSAGLRWALPELAEMRSAVHRLLRPALGDDLRLWARLRRAAPGFPGTLPDLAAAVVAGRATEAAGSDAEQQDDVEQDDIDQDDVEQDTDTAAAVRRAVEALAPAPPRPLGSVDRELALASLAVPNAMGDLAEDVRWVRACLDRGVLTGEDVVRHKAPAAWALDEDHWLGVVDHPDRHDRPAAVLAARAEADRLLDAALGRDPDAWWQAARALPDFPGTLPELLAAVTEGTDVGR